MCRAGRCTALIGRIVAREDTSRIVADVVDVGRDAVVVGRMGVVVDCCSRRVVAGRAGSRLALVDRSFGCSLAAGIGCRSPVVRRSRLEGHRNRLVGRRSLREDLGSSLTFRKVSLMWVCD